MKDHRRSIRAGAGAPFLFTDDVIEAWTGLARAGQPWSEMYLDDVTGGLRAVIDDLLHLTDEPDTAARRTRLRRTSRAHGAFRRTQGCSGQILTEEVRLIGEAISRILLRSGASPAIVTVVFDALASDLRAVERGAYGGFIDWSERPSSGA